MIPKFRDDKSDATGVCALVLAAMRKDAATGAPSNPIKRRRCNVVRRKRKLFEDTPKRRKRRHVPVPVQTHATPIATAQKTDDPLMATPVVTAHQTDDPITPGFVQPPPAQEKKILMATLVVTAHQTDDPITPGFVQPSPTQEKKS